MDNDQRCNDQHGHGHAHDHDQAQAQAHVHDSDFDWEAMADHLELEATMLLPMVDEIIRVHTPHVDWPAVHRVLDLGSGPGIITCALAEHAPAAQVTALDTSVPLLNRARAHAATHDLARRVHTMEADMEAVLPALRPMDVIWTGMVLHHVADPAAVLGGLRNLLQRGGTLVMIEFAGRPTALPENDPVVGAWTRMEAAVFGGIAARLGRDPLTIDWPTLLAAAGFRDVSDHTLVAMHPAPLTAPARDWLTAHLRRSVEWTADEIGADDAATLTELAAQVATRDDLFVRAERRVLIARR